MPIVEWIERESEWEKKGRKEAENTDMEGGERLYKATSIHKAGTDKELA